MCAFVLHQISCFGLPWKYIYTFKMASTFGFNLKKHKLSILFFLYKRSLFKTIRNAFSFYHFVFLSDHVSRYYATRRRSQYGLHSQAIRDEPTVDPLEEIIGWRTLRTVVLRLPPRVQNWMTGVALPSHRRLQRPQLALVRDQQPRLVMQPLAYTPPASLATVTSVQPPSTVPSSFLPDDSGAIGVDCGKIVDTDFREYGISYGKSVNMSN